MGYNSKRTFVLFMILQGGDNTERTILHCDLNNFYASVACHDNPELRDKQVAVCGDPNERHGIVLAKNAAAKRRGVKTGEAIWQAKQKCPSLVTVLPDFKRYAYFSEKAREIYEAYSDLVEPFGPDEAWIDVSGSRLIFGEGREIADKIRRRIRNELGLTVSVGVSFNKIFAKLGSDMGDADTTTEISRADFREKIWLRPANEMMGIGPAAYEKLCSRGITTIGQLANADEKMLEKALGKNGIAMKNNALGLDNSRVAQAAYHRIPKSIGHSTTRSTDLVTNDEVWQILLMLAESVGRELRREKLEATGVALHIRTNTLKVNELQMPLVMPTASGIELAKSGMSLFKKKYDFICPLRSIGIRAIKLVPQTVGAKQTTLFENAEKSLVNDKIEQEMDTLLERFGKRCIYRATLIGASKAESAARPFSQMYK